MFFDALKVYWVSCSEMRNFFDNRQAASVFAAAQLRRDTQGFPPIRTVLVRRRWKTAENAATPEADKLIGKRAVSEVTPKYITDSGAIP
jgi:hypothetical protein